MSHDNAGSRLDSATVVSLAAMALGIFVVADDFTALSVAVVPIENDLDTTLNRAQWVINAYVVMMAVGILLLVAFAVIEARKGDEALVPHRVTKSRQFTGAVLSVTLMSATLFGILVYIPQFLQKELGPGVHSG